MSLASGSSTTLASNSGSSVFFGSYQELPEDAAFITAQIAGNKVVYSVVLAKARNPLTHEDVESHFNAELSKK